MSVLTPWFYNQHPALDGTALYGGYETVPVGGTVKFYPPSEKPRGIPILKKSRIHKRPREKGIEYNL